MCFRKDQRENKRGVSNFLSFPPPISVTANVGETKMKQKRKMAPEPKNIFFSPVLSFSVLLLRFWKRGGGKSGKMEFLNFPSLSSLLFLLFFLRTRLLLRPLLLTTVSRRLEPAEERCVSVRARGRTDVQFSRIKKIRYYSIRENKEDIISSWWLIGESRRCVPILELKANHGIYDTYPSVILTRNFLPL